jgi:site-specific DNA-methyltransferase (adenine-specific)
MSFVIPSRWFAGGKGLDDFRQEMLSDSRIRVLHDFLDSSEIFPGTDIKGGVCYFLWDRDNPGTPVVTTHDRGQVIASSERPLLEPGNDIFIRYEVGLSILRRVVAIESASKQQLDHLALAGEKSFSTVVSSRKPFGIATDYRGVPAPKGKVVIPIHQIGGIGYISDSDIKVGRNLISGWKVLVGYAGSGDQYPSPVIAKPFLARPGSICTETYLVIGPFKTKSEAENVLAYLSTRFGRFMVLLRKASQHITKAVYGFLPLQDFSVEWSDEKLNKKYKLTKEEISFIEKMVKPMEIDHE